MICCQILGDLGANVILVEPPAGVKVCRVGPFADDTCEVNRSLNFWSLKCNKAESRSIWRPALAGKICFSWSKVPTSWSSLSLPAISIARPGLHGTGSG
jgi:hypothetical protein